MDYLFTSESLISFFILVVLEVVLGIDNVIFVSIILNRLRIKSDQLKARRLWMITGILSRSLLLIGLGWLLAQKGKPVITLFEKEFDLASIVMLLGGLFLIYKSVKEIHEKLEGEDPNQPTNTKKELSLSKAIGQIILIDAVFSFDSIITAGGTAKYVEIMIAAVVIAMLVMFLFSPKISEFIHHHPTLKMLALSFLVMIGLSLLMEGWDAETAEKMHLKNYIYFGMAFSFIVELLNMTMIKKAAKKRLVILNGPSLESDTDSPNPQYIECFYWGTNAVKLQIKQLHTIKNYVKAHNLPDMMFDPKKAIESGQTPTVAGRSTDNFIASLVYYRTLPLLSEHLKPVATTVIKDMDAWFAQDPNSQAFQNYKKGIDYLGVILPKHSICKGGIWSETGINAMHSKSRYLGT